jgi:hypothetical protein
LLQPDLPKRLDSWERPQRRRSIGRIQCKKELPPIGADLLGQGIALGFPRRQAVFREAAGVAVEPTGRHPIVQPCTCTSGDTIEGLSEGFPDTFEPVQHLNRGQDVGRVGALATTRFEQPVLAEQRQHQVKDEQFSLAGNQPGTKLTQYRGVKARVGQFKGKRMSGSQGALLLPSPLRTGRAPLNASGSSKPYAIRRSAPVTLGRLS